MRKALKTVATIGLPIAAVLWCSFCILPSPYFRRLINTPMQGDTTHGDSTTFECPIAQEGIGAQPVTVKIHNETPDEVVFHVEFEALERQRPSDMVTWTPICPQNITVPPSRTRAVTCFIDFSSLKTYSDGMYAVEVSAVSGRERLKFPYNQRPYYWASCAIFTEEENLRNRRYVIIVGITGFGLLAWGAALVYQSNWFLAVIATFVLMITLFVLTLLVFPLVPYYGIAWIFEFVMIAGILWWSHRRQKSSTDAHIP